jgi:small GTP-binding protein
MKAIERKLVVLGDSGVGKTALVQRFVEGKFSNEYRPTAGAMPYRKTVELEGKTISLVIWDVAGHTLKIHPAFTSDAKGAILVCDLSRQVTFDSVLQWHSVIKNKLGDIPVIVAGNKSDKLATGSSRPAPRLERISSGCSWNWLPDSNISHFLMIVYD